MISKPRAAAAPEGSNATQPLLFFVSVLTLIDEGLSAGEHEVHHSREFVRRGGVRAGFVHAAAQAAVERSERGVAVRQAHRSHFQRLAHAVGRLADLLVLADKTLPPLILVPGHRPSHEQKCLTVSNRLRSGPISDKIFITAAVDLTLKVFMAMSEHPLSVKPGFAWLDDEGNERRRLEAECPLRADH